ncbi:MAG: BA14K family protein [Mesorhizobium sp.]|nr:BA14K family protein [Mesorhizobium sp.]
MQPLSTVAAVCALLGLALTTGGAVAEPLVVGPVPVYRAAPVIPPYAPGFDRGVIVGVQPGCVTRTCRDFGGLQNRPFHRGYYRHYFDLAEPTYGRSRPLRGNSAYRAPAALDDAGTAWCAERYRSYRLSDNTYQPTRGPRRPCLPPL